MFEGLVGNGDLNGRIIFASKNGHLWRRCFPNPNTHRSFSEAPENTPETRHTYQHTRRGRSPSPKRSPCTPCLSRTRAGSPSARPRGVHSEAPGTAHHSIRDRVPSSSETAPAASGRPRSCSRRTCPRHRRHCRQMMQNWRRILLGPLCSPSRRCYCGHHTSRTRTRSSQGGMLRRRR